MGAQMTPDEIQKDREAGTRPTKHAGYEVDADGNVWSSSNWRGYGRRRLALHPNSHGYPTVKVKTGSAMKKLMVHVAVCEAFHGARPHPHYQVCHINGIRSDNRAENLRWGSAEDNARDRALHGHTRNQNSGKKFCDSGHDLETHGRTRPNGERACRICHARHCRDYRARKAGTSK